MYNTSQILPYKSVYDTIWWLMMYWNMGLKENFMYTPLKRDPNLPTSFCPAWFQ